MFMWATVYFQPPNELTFQALLGLDKFSGMLLVVGFFFFIEHLSTDGKAKIREVMTLGIFLTCECIVFVK